MEILAGAGVHGGEPCRVELVRRGDGGGVRLFVPGFPGPLALADLARLPRQARRATVVGSGEASLQTPEHLLAALLYFAGRPLDIRFSAAELPILDGSALPWREALARLFPDAAGRPAWREAPCDLVWERGWHGGYLRARPAHRLSITCAISRGPLEEACRLETPADAWDGALPARTWIFRREWLRGREAGLLRGAALGAGLLLAEDPAEHASAGPEGPYPLISPSAFRMPAEAARHKALDLLGDLALLGGTLPALRIEVRNGGHAAHHALVEAVLAARRGPGLT